MLKRLRNLDWLTILIISPLVLCPLAGLILGFGLNYKAASTPLSAYLEQSQYVEGIVTDYSVTLNNPNSRYPYIYHIELDNGRLVVDGVGLVYPRQIERGKEYYFYLFTSEDFDCPGFGVTILMVYSYGRAGEPPFNPVEYCQREEHQSQ